MAVQFQSGTLATPSSTVDVASDTIGGLDYQRVKVVWGTTGTATELTTSAGLPVQITKQSSNIAVDVGTLPSVSITSSTAVIGSVLPSSQWTVTTTPSSRVPVDVNSLPSISITSSTQVIGAVLPSSTWTVNQGTSPWVTSIASSTTPIGSIAQSGTWTIGVTSSTGTIGAVLQGTSPWATSINSSTTVIGSVLPSSQWTVTTTPSSRVPVDVNSLPSISITSSTAVIGAVVQGTNPWTVAQTSSTGFLGSVAITSGTVTLTSGTLALGTVTLSSGTQTIGTVIQSSGTVILGRMATGPDVTSLYSSGVTQTIGFANATSSSSLVTLVTTTSGKLTTVLAASFSVSTTSTIDASAQFTSSLGSTDKVYSGKIYFRGQLSPNSVVWDFNPVGWAQTTSSGNLSLQISPAVQTMGVTITYVSL